MLHGDAIPLRNNKGELIDKNNYSSFLDSIIKFNNIYDIKSTKENDLLISRTDNDLVNLYSGIIQSLTLKEFSAAKFFSSELLREYPDAEKFTDVSFLEGQMWELVPNYDSARYYYSRFLKFSAGKFSKRFRGYIYNDSAEHCFTRERIYSLRFVEGQSNEPIQSCLIKIEPRYYFESFSPGFLANREDFSRHDRFIPVVNFNIPPLRTVFLGIGLLALLDDKYALYGEVNRYKDFTNGQIAFPIEAYKAESNRFGINVSPVFYYQVADNVEDYSNRLFVNIGGSISTSYRFNHKLYYGISYLYYVFNNNHKKRSIFFTHNENQFDLSIYYQIIKGMSLKAGMVNDHPVIGLTYVGNLFWYDFKSTSVGLTFNVY
jgi:hypothetical protein